MERQLEANEGKGVAAKLPQLSNTANQLDIFALTALFGEWEK
jgi:hypothetical protein